MKLTEEYIANAIAAARVAVEAKDAANAAGYEIVSWCNEIAKLLGFNGGAENVDIDEVSVSFRADWHGSWQSEGHENLTFRLDCLKRESAEVAAEHKKAQEETEVKRKAALADSDKQRELKLLEELKKKYEANQ